MSVINFKNEGATAKLVRCTSTEFLLCNLFSEKRGQGYAVKLMRSMIEFADREGLTLQLVAKAYGHPIPGSLNNQQLEAFYQRFGFETYSNHPALMVRRPRKIYTASNERNA